MAVDVGRRQFISALGGAAVTWPIAVRAQISKQPPRIGVLSLLAEQDPFVQQRLAAFRKELEVLGWREGRDLHIESQFTTPDRLQSVAKDLVKSEPSAIIAISTPVAAALERETHQIPIVFVDVSDPISSGFIASLARPGGNLTGLLLDEEGISGKWLAMLKEVAPALSRVALLANPKTTPYDYFLRGIATVAPSLAIELVPGQVETPTDIERVIKSLSQLPNGGLIAPPDSTIGRNRNLIIRLTAQHGLPAIYANRLTVQAGGLMSYSPDRVDALRQAASYIDSILRGKKPADLPVQTPTKYETLINLKTARALKLNIPATLLAQADEVIE